MIQIELKGGGSMPALGFGTWQLEGEGCVRSVREALDIGYRHIDTAQIYENEYEVGKALVQSRLPREQLFITTKLWTNNFTAPRVASSADESLRKLGLDYVDLLLIHWPNADVPLGETLSAMEKLQKFGKVKAIGVSNFPVSWMKKAVECSGVPVVCNQVEYHALLSQDAVLDYARAHNIAITAYSPLARAKLAKHPVLARIGEKYGKSASQVALRWLVEQPGVAAIPKAASEANARANFEIFDFSLSAEDTREISALQGNGRVINPGFAPVWDAA